MRSYRKKREQMRDLEIQVETLEKEKEQLLRLLKDVEDGRVDDIHEEADVDRHLSSVLEC